MATKKRTSRSATTFRDALALLRADHEEVQQLFEQFEKTRSPERQATVAARIRTALTVHAQIEEEIFYPAVRGALRNQDLLDEAAVEHASVKQLIGQIEQSQPGDPLFKARVSVLGEYVKHHVKEEQNAMFAEVRKTKLDLKALGEQLQARKAELMQARKAEAMSSQ